MSHLPFFPPSTYDPAIDKGVRVVAPPCSPLPKANPCTSYSCSRGIKPKLPICVGDINPPQVTNHHGGYPPYTPTHCGTLFSRDFFARRKKNWIRRMRDSVPVANSLRRTFALNCSLSMFLRLLDRTWGIPYPYILRREPGNLPEQAQHSHNPSNLPRIQPSPERIVGVGIWWLECLSHCQFPAVMTQPLNVYLKGVKEVPCALARGSVPFCHLGSFPCFHCQLCYGSTDSLPNFFFVLDHLYGLWVFYHS